MKKQTWLNIIGIFLVVLGLIRIFQLLFFGVPVHVFWLCNHVIVFIGLAILFRNPFWLIGEFCFLFVGQMIWLVGFLLYLFFGIMIPGNTTHLIYDPSFINIITLLVHFLTLPLGLWAIILLNKKSKFAWTGGLIHAVVLMPIVLYFAPTYNLNCFNNPCLAFLPDTLLYTILILPGYFLLSVIPLNYLVNWIVGKRKKGK